ncbi:hypothetical protein H6F77_02005 [Microcoleus sp. FACHB-831]|uniref:CU044_2847 family protein n=1 Tax=Microcoleus sp. FACHB-831 TaxID=2692827 RepID=UPI00168528CD|nr:CU044_2847 family protein [Microcoleus sp. FACHB-831]MBD1919892.1 hypothetical protein [Microcoleus sp. FACHB-831]
MKIVEFELESGESIFVEVKDTEQTDGRIGLGDDLIEKAHGTFESALEKVKPVANTIINKLRNLNQPADEVEVKFGLKMTAQAGAIVAGFSGDANYEITLKWKRDSKNGGTA